MLLNLSVLVICSSPLLRKSWSGKSLNLTNQNQKRMRTGLREEGSGKSPDITNRKCHIDICKVLYTRKQFTELLLHLLPQDSGRLYGWLKASDAKLSSNTTHLLEVTTES